MLISVFRLVARTSVLSVGLASLTNILLLVGHDFYVLEIVNTMLVCTCLQQ